MAQPVIIDGSVVTLNLGILLRLARLEMTQFKAFFLPILP